MVVESLKERAKAKEQDYSRVYRKRGPIRRRVRQLGLAMTALVWPQPLKRLLYRLFFGYRIGKGARIGISLVDCEELVMDSSASIGNFNVLMGCGYVRMGEHAKICVLNILRGGERIDLESYSMIGRFNVINSIPDAEVTNPVVPRFHLGHGAVVVSEHRIDFTDGVSIGRRSIIAGRNSSLWTHMRQQTQPITIGEFCYLGSESRMAPGSGMGDYCMVSLGSVLMKRFDKDKCVIGGVPARMVQELSAEDIEVLHYKTRPDLPNIPGIDTPREGE